MTLRRILAILFLVTGGLLCGMAVLHHLRGFEAQSAGRRFLQDRRPAKPLPVDNPESAVASICPPDDRPQQEPYPFGQPIARLRIPSAQIDAIVFGGSENDVLEMGPGHVRGTELPGRRSGWNNCVIIAHRDSHFRNLGWLREGQRIELTTPAGDETFRVVSREIVEPTAVRVLMPTDQRRLTLITCYPFNALGPAPRRLVVVAAPEPHEAGAL